MVKFLKSLIAFKSPYCICEWLKATNGDLHDLACSHCTQKALYLCRIGLAHHDIWANCSTSSPY